MNQSRSIHVKQKQPKAYQLLMNDHQFYLRTTSKQFSLFSGIKINRLTSKITTFTSQQQFFHQISTNSSSAIKSKQFIDLILGLLIINHQPYLLLCTQAQSPGILQSDRIYQIKNIKSISFKHKFLYNSQDQTENEKILAFIKEILIKDNFYYCYKEDITLTRTKYEDKQVTETKYCWNQSLLEYFKKSKLPWCWTIPVIQGHVRQIHCQNQYFTFYYLIISRRSKQMSGTRFNHRGIDEQFNAANFVQTEEIFICHNYLFSHVSLRGSAPFYWVQENVKADIVFNHKHEHQQMDGFGRHYKMLEEEYKGKICTINLLSKGKSPQKDLKALFQLYYSKLIKDKYYLYFDLNQQMKQQNGQRLIDLFMSTSKQIYSIDQNFFVMDRFTRKVINVQKIYPRINCLDCIDRTNVIMARISQCYLEQIQVFINSRVKIKEKVLALGKYFKKNIIKIWVQLGIVYANIQGNRISMLYCGTQSVANHMTKKQNNSLLSFLSGGIKSINRYYNANIGDNFKHECIQHFLHRKPLLSTTYYFTDNISTKILNQLKYSTYEQLKTYIVTWNCNQVDPYKLNNKQKQQLFNFLSEDIDFIVFNLQQIVQLSSYNVLLGNNQSIISDWAKIILNSLNDREINHGSTASRKQFHLLTSHDLVGLATFVFCSNKIQNKISAYQWLDIKTGFKGNSGHKGAIMLFIQIDSSWITFINCHLASGQDKKSQRYQDIEFIHNQSIKQLKKRRLFDISEFKFFVGDMNFSLLQLKNEYIREILSKISSINHEKLSTVQLRQLLQPLLQKDQKFRTLTGYLNSYQQAQILFMPTYKFDFKSKSYDNKKTPAWYDRILYKSSDAKKIATIRYNDINVYLSDHKPVYGMFNLLIKKENLQRKIKYIEAYLYDK